MGLGADSGGSIRQPAHNCGIVGLKPHGLGLPIGVKVTAKAWREDIVLAVADHLD